MTQKQITLKTYLIKNIQINKNKVFEDDDMRYDFMLSRFGKTSLTKMSIDELKQMLCFCLKNVSDIQIAKCSEAQVKKIYDLWHEKARNKGVMALYEFIYKITKKRINTVDELTKSEATKFIITLNKLTN